jgi:hypothetical protein
MMSPQWCYQNNILESDCNIELFITQHPEKGRGIKLFGPKRIEQRVKRYAVVYVIMGGNGEIIERFMVGYWKHL